jgi:hypothetical protein
MEPVPGTKITLATEVFLRPIPKYADFVFEVDKDTIYFEFLIIFF